MLTLQTTPIDPNADPLGIDTGMQLLIVLGIVVIASVCFLIARRWSLQSSGPKLQTGGEAADGAADSGGRVEPQYRARGAVANIAEKLANVPRAPEEPRQNYANSGGHFAKPAGDFANPIAYPRPAQAQHDTNWFKRIAFFQAGAGRHILIAAGTNGGKTTTALALIKERSKFGKFAVVDTNARRNQWGANYEPIGARGNTPEAERFFKQALAELKRRKEAYYNGEPLEPLTIVVEEINELVDDCPTVSEFIRRVSSQGRKYDMLLVLCGQSDRVVSLGLEGRGDLREGNFVNLYLANKALEKMGNSYPFPNYTRPACYNIDGRIEAFDPAFLLNYQGIEINPANVWSPVRNVPNDLPDLAFEARTPQYEPVRNVPNASGTVIEAEVIPVDLGVSQIEKDVIEALISCGWSNDKIQKHMPGVARAQRLEQIKAIRATLE